MFNEFPHHFFLVHGGSLSGPQERLQADPGAFVALDVKDSSKGRSRLWLHSQRRRNSPYNGGSISTLQITRSFSGKRSALRSARNPFPLGHWNRSATCNEHLSLLNRVGRVKFQASVVSLRIISFDS